MQQSFHDCDEGPVLSIIAIMYVFGDQNADFHDALEALYRTSPDLPLLKAFLEEALEGVKSVLNVSTHDCNEPLIFNTFLDLYVSQRGKTAPDTAISVTIAAVTQLGCYIRYISYF